VINEGRPPGGRAPYGYIVVDAGPHPNPRKAIEGFRLRVLETDETAEVVRRIFADYLNGKGDRAIANGLNRDGIACPSARRPDQNRHRLVVDVPRRTRGGRYAPVNGTSQVVLRQRRRRVVLRDTQNRDRDARPGHS
ncbi:MAG TPA: recombinase family protein, partial [Kribbella sp.]